MFHATIQYIHVSIDICANKIEVPVRMVDIHLIFVRFNGKLAITDRDLYHSAALVCGELGVFSEMFILTFAWNGNDSSVHGVAALMVAWLGTHLVFGDSEKW